MRFHFDPLKSTRLRKNPKRGIGFEEVQEIFTRPYYQDQRSGLPEQYRAIGWVDEKLYLLIFEMREDEEGEFYHLVTRYGRPRERSENFMKKTVNKTAVSAESVARMADKGKDVSKFFTNAGRMMAPVQRVNVDFTATMLEELDREAKGMNISRQAVIKTLLRRALDENYVAAASRLGMK